MIKANLGYVVNVGQPVLYSWDVSQKENTNTFPCQVCNPSTQQTEAKHVVVL